MTDLIQSAAIVVLAIANIVNSRSIRNLSKGQNRAM